MSRRWIAVWVVSVITLLPAGRVWGAIPLVRGEGIAAQSWPAFPPTIVEFTIDVPAISLANAEAGLTPAHLSWRTVGMLPEHRLVLYTFRLNRWEPLLPPEAAPLPGVGEVSIAIEHPLTFGPPTYSLVIADASGQTLDQRVVTVPYRAEDAPPLSIDLFRADVTELDAAALAARTVRVPVVWQVSGRQPTMHLVFEQVLETGATVSVELPRNALWVASQGEGVVAPLFTTAGQPVRLQLRVVDLRDGTTLATYPLPPIPVVSSATALSAAPVVPSQGSSGAPGSSGGASAGPRAAEPVEVLQFTAAPETIPRGGTVTLTWDVRNAVEVGVWLVEPGGRLAQMAPTAAAQGMWTVTVPEAYVDEAPFMLFARSADGEQRQETVVVDVICPHVYFFDMRGQVLSCPADAARTVQAAYQEFERGFMVWRADISEIYVFFRDTGLVNRFRDTWMGEWVDYPEAPPPGLYKPDRGFGRVWVDNPQVRAGLGWATGFERGYAAWVQQSGDFRYPRLYLTLPDGTVIYLVENTWKIWGAP